MSSSLFKKVINKICLYMFIKYMIYGWYVIKHNETKRNKTKPNQTNNIYIYLNLYLFLYV